MLSFISIFFVLVSAFRRLPSVALSMIEQDGYTIVMSAAEKGLYAALMCRNETRSVFEYGSGGSTLLAGACDVAEIVSIDSSIEWLTTVNNSKVWRESKSKLTLGHVDIGPTAKWGRPTVTASNAKFHTYAAAISQFRGDHDVVMVDGRFRVGCALLAIRYLSRNGVIVVHDFLKERGYHAVLKYLDVVNQVDTLVFLKPKRLLSLSALSNDIRRYAVIPD